MARYNLGQFLFSFHFRICPCTVEIVCNSIVSRNGRRQLRIIPDRCCIQTFANEHAKLDPYSFLCWRESVFVFTIVVVAGAFDSLSVQRRNGQRRRLVHCCWRVFVLVCFDLWSMYANWSYVMLHRPSPRNLYATPRTSILQSKARLEMEMETKSPNMHIENRMNGARGSIADGWCCFYNGNNCRQPYAFDVGFAQKVQLK